MPALPRYYEEHQKILEVGDSWHRSGSWLPPEELTLWGGTNPIAEPSPLPFQAESAAPRAGRAQDQRMEMLGTVTAKAAGADSGQILFCCADCSREL